MLVHPVTLAPDRGLARDGRCKQRKINMSMQVCPELISEDWAGGGRGHQPLPLGDGRKN